MTCCVDLMGIRYENIVRISHDADHLIRFERLRIASVLGTEGFGNPNFILIADVVLTEHALHCQR